MNAVELFVVQLAKHGWRAFKQYTRGLEHADRDELTQRIIVECWEKRDAYDPTKGSLEQWIMDISYSVSAHFKRGVFREKERRVLGKLTSFEKLSRASSGEPLPTPEEGFYPKHPYKHPAHHDKHIDHQVERLLNRPTTGRADCPSCWRCRWYDGFKPAAWKPPTHVDEEVRKAIDAIERRKIEIAGGHPDDYLA